MNKIKIAPSILSADFADLGKEVEKLSQAGSDMIHIDVMDGSFVPNITIGPVVIKSIRKYTKIPFDVHLMVNSPDHLFEDFVAAGSDIITVHYEAIEDIKQSLSKIKQLGVKSGISLMPATKAEEIDFLLDQVDLVLVMTVQPGFGGQAFMMDQLEKISYIANRLEKIGRKDVILSVDGGINDKTAPLAIKAGANMLVSGSYIFRHEDYAAAVEGLRVDDDC
jgi:ribulose-phosphate 3-epimerase